MDWEKLEKVFKLEIEKGCRDTAVVGGLESFLSGWIKSNPGINTPGNTAILLKKGATGYSQMLPPARKKYLNSVLSNISVKVNDRGNTPYAPSPKPSSRKPKALATAEVDLDSSVLNIKGVNKQTALKLEKLGVSTIRDVLYLFPHRHLDYSRLKTVSQLSEGAEETIVANLWEVREVKLGGRRSTEAVLGDSTGNVRSVWFNNPYLVRQLKAARQLVLSGRVRFFRGSPVFESPDWEFYEEHEELIHTGRLVPVYPLTSGLHQRSLRKLVKNIIDSYADNVPEFLPAEIIQRNGMPGLSRAIKDAHFPADENVLARANKRLAFDELFVVQLCVQDKKRKWQLQKTSPIDIDRHLLEYFISSLPFELTGAQARVLSEILSDMGRSVPMSRLLQGEVGSGKTIVALAAILMAYSSGRQAAFMAPTGILARQHFDAVTELMGRSGSSFSGDQIKRFTDFFGRVISVALLTSDTKNSVKREIKEEVSLGKIDILIGTHAVIQDEVAFCNLGLAVIDEQHRFGVEQRQTLRQKGQSPHVLVMTATPIPRTLAMTIYGDLDISVIDEMPPGRSAIKTRWIKSGERYKAYNFVRKQVAEGRQVFIICPLVEESDALQAKAATAEFQTLTDEVFPDLRLGLLHGRLGSVEKDRVMMRYLGGELDILVATPVIEVGIDVPNASLIIIESAERFGLSQLHQFRGRVGRGMYQGYCILIADTSSQIGIERLKAIEELHDGFKLAEKDLELRGPGEFFGTRQSGLPDLKMARLSDVGLLVQARKEAESVFEADPELKQPGHRQMGIEMKRVCREQNSEAI